MENDIDSESLPGQGMYSAASLAREHADHEFGAQFDDVRERYSGELADLRIDDEIEADHGRYLQKVWDAGFGTNDDAYEEYRKTILDSAPQLGQGAKK